MENRVKKILLSICSILITSTVLLVVLLGYCYQQLPSVSTLTQTPLQVPMRIYTRDHVLIGEFGERHCYPVSTNQVPDLMKQAILSIEDQRFFHHSGVDFIGLVRAAKELIITGKKSQGASTITMQVARNYFLSREKTYTRKINEIMLALLIEHNFSKEKILELYLNKVYFGQKAYGIKAAVRNYYGKELEEITLAEMAMLAGLPKAPSRNNPIDNPKQATIRRNYVLLRMLGNGHITPVEYKAAIYSQDTSKRHGPEIQVKAEYVAETVRQSLIDAWGESAYNQGLIIHTSIDSHMQAASSAALTRGLIAYDQRHKFHDPEKKLSKNIGNELEVWAKELKLIPVINKMVAVVVLDKVNADITVMFADKRIEVIDKYVLLKNTYKQNQSWQTGLDTVTRGDVIRLKYNNKDKQYDLVQVPAIEGAVVAINPKTGGVLAMSGGFDFKKSNFNRAIQAWRQPGSSIKPFIYSKSLDMGYTLASIINDTPISIEDTGENHFWRPLNVDKQFKGPIRVREALKKSRNLATIRLLDKIGIPGAKKHMEKFGFDISKQPDALSLALGSGMVTPLQMATGYAIIANAGESVQPYMIESITDQQGDAMDLTRVKSPFLNMVSQKSDEVIQLSTQNNQVISKENAYLINDVLLDVIKSGTGRRAKILHREDVAGKTGSTNDLIDAWFCGYNMNVSASVWVGKDNMTSTHEYGSQAALPIWIDFMKAALNGSEIKQLLRPANIITSRIDAETGRAANPETQQPIFEIFKKGTEPSQQGFPISSTNEHDSISVENLEALYN